MFFKKNIQNNDKKDKNKPFILSVKQKLKEVRTKLASSKRNRYGALSLIVILILAIAFGGLYLVRNLREESDQAEAKVFTNFSPISYCDDGHFFIEEVETPQWSTAASAGPERYFQGSGIFRSYQDVPVAKEINPYEHATYVTVRCELSTAYPDAVGRWKILVHPDMRLVDLNEVYKINSVASDPFNDSWSQGDINNTHSYNETPFTDLTIIDPAIATYSVQTNTPLQYGSLDIENNKQELLNYRQSFNRYYTPDGYFKGFSSLVFTADAVTTPSTGQLPNRSDYIDDLDFEIVVNYDLSNFDSIFDYFYGCKFWGYSECILSSVVNEYGQNIGDTASIDFFKVPGESSATYSGSEQFSFSRPYFEQVDVYAGCDPNAFFVEQVGVSSSGFTVEYHRNDETAQLFNGQKEVYMPRRNNSGAGVQARCEQADDPTLVGTWSIDYSTSMFNGLEPRGMYVESMGGSTTNGNLQFATDENDPEMQRYRDANIPGVIFEPNLPQDVNIGTTPR